MDLPIPLPFREKTVNGVLFYEAPSFAAIPQLRHGFSTRLGGVSREPHLQTMNFGFGRGENRAVTEENYRIFARAVGLSPSGLVFANQTHTHRVARVGAAHRGVGVYRPPVYFPDTAYGDETNEVDALVSDVRGVSIGVRVADCVPILFCDPEAGVIGAAHAGWRGTLDNIAVLTLYEMEELGAHAERVHVAIGPCIGPCCYEVDHTFYEKFLYAVGSELCAEAFTKTDTQHPHADLSRINEGLLVMAGVLPSHIEQARICTCCHADRFHSHRATGGVRGTGAAVVGMLGDDE